MKLDGTVYLVGGGSGSDRPPQRFSRRRLLATTAFAFGLGASAGVGFGLWRATPTAAAQPESLPPNAQPIAQPNARLQWALDLQAADDPTELIRQQRAFRIVLADELDPRLVSGLERLVLAVLDGDPRLELPAAAVARSLVADISSYELASSLRHHLPALRRVR